MFTVQIPTVFKLLANEEIPNFYPLARFKPGPAVNKAPDLPNDQIGLIGGVKYVLTKKG